MKTDNGQHRMLEIRKKDNLSIVRPEPIQTDGVFSSDIDNERQKKRSKVSNRI
jgi:hypothetical protein